MEPSKRQRRRQKRRDEIADAAMSMIAAEGIGAFSVNRLADAVDLTPGALYRYFDSREMILAAVELQVLQEFDRYFASIDDALGESSALERVVGLAFGYVRLEELRPQRFQLLSHFISGFQPILSDEIAGGLIEPAMTIFGRLATRLEDAGDAGALDAADGAVERVALLWSSLHGVLERRKLARFAPELFDPTRLAAALLRSLLVGWGAKPEEVDRALEQCANTSLYSEILEDIDD